MENTQKADVSKNKTFYMFPNGTKKNVDTMSANELQKGITDLHNKIRRNERKNAHIRGIVAEMQERLEAVTYDVFKDAQIEEAFEEEATNVFPEVAPNGWRVGVLKKK